MNFDFADLAKALLLSFERQREVLLRESQGNDVVASKANPLLLATRIEMYTNPGDVVKFILSARNLQVIKPIQFIIDNDYFREIGLLHDKEKVTNFYENSAELITLMVNRGLRKIQAERNRKVERGDLDSDDIRAEPTRSRVFADFECTPIEIKLKLSEGRLAELPITEVSEYIDLLAKGLGDSNKWQPSREEGFVKRTFAKIERAETVWELMIYLARIAGFSEEEVDTYLKTPDELENGRARISMPGNYLEKIYKASQSREL